MRYYLHFTSAYYASGVWGSNKVPSFCLSLDSFRRIPYFWLTICISASTMWRKVIILPSRVQKNAVLVILSWSLRRTWPIHLHISYCISREVLCSWSDFVYGLHANGLNSKIVSFLGICNSVLVLITTFFFGFVSFDRFLQMCMCVCFFVAVVFCPF